MRFWSNSFNIDVTEGSAIVQLEGSSGGRQSLHLNSNGDPIDLRNGGDGGTGIFGYHILQKGVELVESGDGISGNPNAGQYLLTSDGQIEVVRIFVTDTDGDDHTYRVRLNDTTVITIMVSDGMDSTGSYTGPPVPYSAGDLIGVILDGIGATVATAVGTVIITIEMS